ncbi:hypothetical protein A3D78_03165 [Candidatus Gottesmanbacteria bacterium RIFCSPHIGHO2_02_FULL_39_14]|uniref:ComEC/Rec2-related protein domain-containing protein n=1 Tax=Candidatus Gottesmanbacteria bacterium RIFCSPHIGHO2_02_FULL_39_14 TaxID=1798383 RepID=A0A1F5ZYZ8_9BACT|nr:MAG: hypothetical protein A3D78_03165 [Candidatus Gottesmanbacteria bacterium RIFCSPHIGHO2_02_FULL_39_14]
MPAYYSFTSVINSLLAEPQASLLNGILFGVRGNIPKSLYQALIDTGTLHIIALSGMNITILANLTAKITLFLGRKASSILTISLIVLFVWFVGTSPSVVRAAIMGSLSLLAVYFGRQYYGLLALFLTSLIMILFDFSLINNLSFQLSFLATLGIILANRFSVRQVKSGPLGQFISIFKENLKLTVSAQILTLPVILYNFKRISLIAPLANLLVEWAIQPIMVLGFVTGVLGFIWKPLGLIPAWFAWVPLTYLITVIEWLAKIPGASINF